MNLKSKLISYFSNFWDRSKNSNTLSFLEKILFIFLCILEKIYLISFKLVSYFKKKSGNKKVNFKVISVGNISVGGTGKSVFAQFLIKNLKQNGAVISRGYGSNLKNNLIVSDGNKIFYPATVIGDEPFMIADKLKVPVIVGKDRFKSATILENHFKKISLNEKDKSPSFIVLDDSYQNFSLKKDFEILLLDARKPFENGHCLPAGKLREKDISRADAIVFTHANNESSEELLSNSSSLPVFYGKHKVSNLLHLNKKNVDIKNLLSKKVLAFAGIGNFSYFLQSVKDLNLNVTKEIEYPDHYKFSEQDLKSILNSLKEDNCDCVITTSKDWVKILPLLEKIKNWQALPIYVLEIEFAFLTNSERIRFLGLVESIF